MVELGSKHECISCSVKFYDMGKPEAVCPACGANQKDAAEEQSANLANARAKKKASRKKSAKAKPAKQEAKAAEPEKKADEPKKKAKKKAKKKKE